MEIVCCKQYTVSGGSLVVAIESLKGGWSCISYSLELGMPKGLKVHCKCWFAGHSDSAAGHDEFILLAAAIGGPHCSH